MRIRRACGVVWSPPPGPRYRLRDREVGVDIPPAFYAMLAAGQALLVGYGLATEGQVSVWIPLISAPSARLLVVSLQPTPTHPARMAPWVNVALGYPTAHGVWRPWRPSRCFQVWR